MTDTTTKGGARPGAGAPPKPANRKAVRIMISLPPEMAAWLRAQPDGISKTVQGWIAEAMR